MGFKKRSSGAFNRSKYGIDNCFYSSPLRQGKNECSDLTPSKEFKEKYDLTDSNLKQLARKRFIYITQFKGTYYITPNENIDPYQLKNYIKSNL